MLMWQASATRAEDVEALAAHAQGTVECLLREDRQGSVILCEQGRVPHGVLEKRLTPLISAGHVDPQAGPWLFLVGIWTPVEYREEFLAWYQCEHGPILLECPQWSGFQLMEAAADDGCQFHVLHRLAERTALDSEQRHRSRATPWFKRLSNNRWFDQAFDRVLCHRLSLLRQ